MEDIKNRKQEQQVSTTVTGPGETSQSKNQPSDQRTERENSTLDQEAEKFSSDGKELSVESFGGLEIDALNNRAKKQVANDDAGTVVHQPDHK